jgi:CheY-like chemotaxis protein
MGVTSARDAKRVLVVEDELLLGILIEGMLNELGHEVVTIAPRLSTALAAVESETFNLAILDLRLYGESVDSVAAALVTKGIPFIFATGFGRDGVPEPYRNRPVLQKPFAIADLERAIEGLG